MFGLYTYPNLNPNPTNIKNDCLNQPKHYANSPKLHRILVIQSVLPMGHPKTVASPGPFLWIRTVCSATLLGLWPNVSGSMKMGLGGACTLLGFSYKHPLVYLVLIV